jgi:hypothetical protein
MSTRFTERLRVHFDRGCSALMVDLANSTVCSSCGERVWWGISKHRKLVPLILHQKKFRSHDEHCRCRDIPLP